MVPLWVYLAILGFLTFYTHEIRVAADMGWYMNSALNIFLGKGYADIDGSLILDRGPVFPAMIVAFYWLLGPSPWSAFWPVRVFCVLNPIMVYFLGEKFFGKKVGFAAALLVLSSYSADYWSYRHIDAVWPFFILAANYFIYLGFEKEKLRFFFISGVCFGTAILTKEVAILFLPLPLLIFLWVSEYRKKQRFSVAVVSTAVAVIMVIPWVFYLWRYDGLNLIIGMAGPWVAGSVFGLDHAGTPSSFAGSVEILISRLGDFGVGLWQHYFNGRNSIQANFMLAPGFVAAWIFTVVSAFKGDKSAKILVLNFFLFSPILFFVGKGDWRLGQSIFFLLLSYLALAFLLSWFADRMLSLKTDKHGFSTWLFFMMTTTLVAVQVFGESKRDLGYKYFIRDSVFYELLGSEKPNKTVLGPFGDKHLNGAIEEIKRIAAENDAIMVDWYTYARATYFKMGGKHPVSRMPLLWCFKHRILFDRRRNYEDENPLWIHSSGRPLAPLYNVFMLFESDLLEEIEDKKIKYVLLTPRMWQLNDYFSRSSSFEEILTIGTENKPRNMYRVYHVVGLKKLKQSVNPIFTEVFRQTMRKLKSHDKKKYEYFRDNYIYGLASFTPSEFKEIELDLK